MSNILTVLSSRFANLVGFSLIVLVIVLGFYLQWVDGLQPCPLCWLQRISFIALGMIFFMRLFVTQCQYGKMFLDMIGLVIAAFGIAIAGRQIWIQHFPTDSQGDCGVSLMYMMHILSPWQILERTWQGGAECAEVHGTFLSLSLSEWSFIFFMGFFLFLIVRSIHTVWHHAS